MGWVVGCLIFGVFALPALECLDDRTKMRKHMFRFLYLGCASLLALVLVKVFWL